jgi:hypothetical protein
VEAQVYTRVSPWGGGGVVVDKVALGQVFSEVLGFHLSVSFHCGSPCTHITWDVKNRPVGDQSLEA